MNKQEKMELSEWPDGMTRINLVSTTRGSRTLHTHLAIDQIEDLIRDMKITTEREELAELIEGVGEHVPDSSSGHDYINTEKAADAILAAGYRRLRKP